MTILTTMGPTEYAILLFNLVFLCGIIGGLWYLLSRLRQLVS
ncbi:hypothetical protein [Natrinema hispanicum]|uniref:Uncharacterized protein n=1 Tax=Natrinema hispanicum TaxID=392421 RepID=A0A1I0GMJ4_9EURY|nr:hypothetical protein [Natrinema hispanicum]SDC99109.1 hypothetical protein SAMN05192552_101084 [Natrinema hispanicum]SET72442.1 hypothetical protein SAMN04488694_11141 [Natrinema hispanicum]